MVEVGVINEGSFQVAWKEGTPEVATLSIFFATILGLPLFLQRTELLTIPAVIFYIILYIFGFFGHIDDINQEAYDRISKNKIYLAIGLGLLGFLIIQIMFFIGLVILATSETVQMDKWELLIFNLTFVISAEELVFRDSLPFALSKAFERFMKEGYAIGLAFTLSSVAFGLMHIWTYDFDTLAVGKAILAGIILSIIRIFGGLLASYISHLAYNTLNIMGMYSIAI